MYSEHIGYFINANFELPINNPQSFLNYEPHAPLQSLYQNRLHNFKFIVWSEP